MIVAVLILLGLCLGSFVNALVWRLHAKRDFVRERSECFYCHHVLAPKDLVPVLSWLVLRGRCRYCRHPISDSPLVELLVPTVLVLSYLYWPLPLQGVGLFQFALWVLFVTGFAALAVYDFKWFLLPNKIVFPLMVLAAIQLLGTCLVFGGHWESVVGSLVGVGVMSGLFYVIFVLSQGRWIGFGDVKLAVVLGLLAGGALEALLVLLIASLIGVAVAIPLVIKGKASRKTHLPFGPMLIIGMLVVQLWGQQIIDWYTSLILP